MKKKLIITAAILLLLLFIFFAFLQYRQYSSYKIPIHSNAQTVIRINTDKFIKSFIQEYGINFSKKISGKDDSLKNTGIYFPGNLFVYNISSRFPSTFFCTLPVYDLDDFTGFIKKRFKIQLTQTAGFRTGINSDSSISIACNDKYFSIAYSPKKEPVLDVLIEILSGTNILASNKSLVDKLNKQNTHIAAVNNQWIATMNFSDKSILLQANFDSFNKVNIPEKCKQRIPDKKSIASFSLSAFPLADLFKKQYNIKEYSIETDSILQYFNGYAGIEMGSIINQKDTITTYEYDDNFEKVEKQTIIDVKVPSIKITMDIKPGLINYLKKQQIISLNNTLNKSVFPLYNVSVYQTQQALYFSTDTQETVFSDSLISTNNFLDLKIDLKRDSTVLDFIYLQPYTKNIIDIQLRGKKKQQGISLDAEIIFKQVPLKFIIDLINSL